MLKLIATDNCPGCKAVAEAMEELCIAHEVIFVSEKDDSKDKLPKGTRPPVLIDEGKIVQGSKNIIAHLEKLSEFKELWYKYQSDACYCDEPE